MGDHIQPIMKHHQALKKSLFIGILHHWLSLSTMINRKQPWCPGRVARAHTLFHATLEPTLVTHPESMVSWHGSADAGTGETAMGAIFGCSHHSPLITITRH